MQLLSYLHMPCAYTVTSYKCKFSHIIIRFVPSLDYVALLQVVNEYLKINGLYEQTVCTKIDCILGYFMSFGYSMTLCASTNV